MDSPIIVAIIGSAATILTVIITSISNVSKMMADYVEIVGEVTE